MGFSFEAGFREFFRKALMSLYNISNTALVMLTVLVARQSTKRIQNTEFE